MSNSKVLMIKPSFKPYTAYPIGFAYVLGCLDENNIEFDFIDLEKSSNWMGKIKKQLKNNHYYAVATGGLIGSYVFFQQLTRLIHRINSSMPVILGGNIVKDASDDLLFNTIGINYGIIGEAETSLPDLLNAIKLNHHINDIPGIIYRDESNKVLKNKPNRLSLDIINVFPAWHYFDMSYYITQSPLSSVGESLRVFPVLTGRGCTGACAFCSPTIGGFRKRPIEDVLKEIVYVCEKYDFELIQFYNEMFYPTNNLIQEFCHKYKEYDLNKPWCVGIRVDSNIDIETFKLMKSTGCIEVSAGIESGSDRILNGMRKKTTSEQIKIFFSNAKKAEMPTSGTFIIGYEDETEEDIKQTVDLVIDGKINTNGSLMYVYPGTQVYKNACKKGLIKNELKHLERITRLGTTLYSPYIKKEFFNMTSMSHDNFINVAIREVRRYNTFIFNSHQVKNTKCNLIQNDIYMLLSITGNCFKCDNSIELTYNITSGMEYLGICGEGGWFRSLCPNCLSVVVHNVFDCKENYDIQDHFKFFKNKLINCKRIVFFGINQDLLFLLKVNLFDVNYKNILGVYDPSGDYTASEYVNLKVLSKHDIKQMNPDCILVLDSTLNISRVKKLCNSNKDASPEILYLTSDDMRVEINSMMERIKSHNRTKLLSMYFTRKARKYFHKFRPFVHYLNIKYPLFAEFFEILKSKYHSNRD